MFTTGRVIFICVFLIAFVGAMIYAYRKDMKQVRAWFRNPWQILIAIGLILLIYIVFSRLI